MFLMLNHYIFGSPLYAPNKFCVLCAGQVFLFAAGREKMRYFGKFRFIYRHKKTPLTIQHKAILSRVHKFFARFHLDFSLWAIAHPLTQEYGNAYCAAKSAAVRHYGSGVVFAYGYA